MLNKLPYIYGNLFRMMNIYNLSKLIQLIVSKKMIILYI